MQTEKPNETDKKTVYISFSAEVSQVTTETLLGVCAQQVNNGIDTVHLLISTPGGTVMNGMNIYNLLRGMPFHLITHNVGNVNSIGNVLFLSGNERYACKNSTFMFHGVGLNPQPGMRLEEKSMREYLDGIIAGQETIGGVILDRTNIEAEEVKELFLRAKTRDPNYARIKGIINDIREVEIPKGAPLIQLVFKR